MFWLLFSLFSTGEHSVTALRAQRVSAAQIAQRWKLKIISSYSKKKKEEEEKMAVVEKDFQ